MADSTTHIDVITASDDDIEDRVNELFDASSPSMTFGRHGALCVGFTFAIYGGKFNTGGSTPTPISNQSFDLSSAPSSTRYLYVNADGTFTISAIGPDDSPSIGESSILLYTLVMGTSSITSYVDHRLSAVGLGGGGASFSALVTAVEVGDSILLTRISDGKQLLLGPFA